MSITATQVKELRDRIGAGMMDCKRALEEASGDIEKAIEILRKRGIAKAEKKAGREANEGSIISYIHPGSRLGVLLELNCETDFVARTEDFQQLGKDLAMQIAAANPMVVERSQMDKATLEREKEIYKEQAINEGKPEKVIDRIVAGKMEKFYQQEVLLEQPFIKEPDISVKQRISETIAKLGENIYVRRFARFELGERTDKKS
jgi:elongation factor Ts